MTAKELVITDLTRMSGTRVCIAGYTPQRECVRPLLRDGGLDEAWLYQDGVAAIRPFARIVFDLLEAKPHPPHSEDRIVIPDYRPAGMLADGEREPWLQAILDPSVAAIFGAPIVHDAGAYIAADAGRRSLGTVRAQISAVEYYWQSDRWNYHLSFTDASGATYRLGVTDLAFRAVCEWQRITRQRPPEAIAAGAHRRFSTLTVYLRVGLSRGWARHPDRCYLQINAIHTFPDYLHGKCFADYRV